MTLRLVLTRHAKSDWADAATADHDRPLNARGRDSARAMGNWLRSQDATPDTALVSTAKRAVDTWSGLSAAFTRTVEVRLMRALYLAPPEDILAALAPLEVQSALVIAHNPGMAALAQWLVDETPASVEFHRFPTCATLILDIAAQRWADLGPRSGAVAGFAVPRDLMG